MAIEKVFDMTTVVETLKLVQVLNDGSLAPLPLKTGGVTPSFPCLGIQNGYYPKLVKMHDGLIIGGTYKNNDFAAVRAIHAKGKKCTSGAALRVNDGDVAEYEMHDRANADQLLAVYAAGYSRRYPTARALNVSQVGGLTGTMGTALTFESYGGYIHGVAGVADDRVYAFVEIPVNSYYKNYVFNVDTAGNVTKSTDYDITNHSVKGLAMCKSAANKAAILVRDSGNSNYLTLYITNTSGALQYQAVIDTAYAYEADMCYVEENKVAITYLTSESGYKRNTVLVNTATGVSPGEPIIKAGGTSATNDYTAIAKSGTGRIVITCRSDKNGATNTGKNSIHVYAIDGFNLSLEREGDVSFDGPAGLGIVDTIEEGNIVYMGSNYPVTVSTDQYIRAGMIIPEDVGVNGIPFGIAVTPNKVIAQGEVKGFTGLIPGQKYYADDQGNIGTTGTCYVGYAISDTVLYIPQEIYLKGVS